MIKKIPFFKSETRDDLDFLLSHSPQDNFSLNEKMNWLRQILNWILSESPIKLPGQNFTTGQTQALRVKWLLYLLDRHPEWKTALSETLSDIISETEIFDLLLSGLHQKSGIISEFMQRVSFYVMPHLPDEKNLAQFIENVFKDEKDALSILKIDSVNFEKLVQIFSNGAKTEFSHWKINLTEAMKYLSLQIAALGQTHSLRKLMCFKTLDENPFYKLNLIIVNLVESRNQSLDEIYQWIKECKFSIDEVYAHMDDHGVSVDMVYQLERIRFLLRRLNTLLKFFTGEQLENNQIQEVVVQIIADTVRAKSLGALIDDNTSLISKKIVENSAETGEHYIANNRAESISLFNSAMGGGAVTAITVLLKFLIAHLPGSPFFIGFISSLNYSASFLFLQAQKFTLGTKQPAMTAAYISQKLDPKSSDFDPAVAEIIKVIRSQIISVLGNVISVIPCVLLICFGYFWLSGSHFLNEQKAIKTLSSFSILGPTPFYAAFTGVLLFASSLCSGWFYHWVRYREIPQAMAKNKKLIKWLGSEKARLFAIKFKKSSAGIAANVSLGFLLGLTPLFAEFFGFPLDVRHVTLSTGSMAAAVSTLGTGVLTQGIFIQAILGVFTMAILNILVSFILALLVALRAKKISLKTSFQLLKSIFNDLRKRML